MNAQTRNFKKLSARYAGDTKLKKALEKASGHLFKNRQAAFEALPAGEDLRNQAQELKAYCLEHLEPLLERLEETVTQQGGKVFRAVDGESAVNYIKSLISARGIQRVVKGKSMTTEEIGLNHYLEALGVEVTETDLGEFIVQLAKEPPSHILGPAIHKSQEDVACLFQEMLGAPLCDQAEELTMIARKHLRERFREAQMGITGANFAVADSGVIVLLENEGNIRYSTSIPPLHVAVMGMEKVIRNFEDLALFMELLARSATGQKLSSYVSVLAPGEPGREFHLVILDNGRSAIREDPAVRPVLSCLRCGSCLNACPVYRAIGGHAYGWIYSGPIGAVLSPLLLGLDQAPDLPFASTLCGACRDICPVKMDIPGLLIELRHRIKEKGIRPWLDGFLAWISAWVTADPERMNRAGRIIRPLLPLSPSKRIRGYRQPAEESFHTFWKRTHHGK